MFKVGDFVVCGHNGVCEVKNIGPLESMHAEKDRVYYTLVPYHDKDTVVFAPVDSQKIPLRDVMTKQEALDLIEETEKIAELQIKEERTREQKYKEAIKTCNGKELIKLIKTIYERKVEREAMGKKMTAADSRYFKAAEDALYNELAISLGVREEEAKNFIKNKIVK